MKKIYLVLLLFLVNANIYSQWNLLNPSPSGAWVNTYFVSSDTGYFCDDLGLILKTTNGGTTWSSLTGEAGTLSMCFLNSNLGFLATGNGILKTTNGGNTFTDVLPYPVMTISKIDFVNATTGYAIGTNTAADSTLIFKTTNTGNTWALIYKRLSTMAAYPYIDFTDVNTGYLIDDYSDIYKTTNGGLNWTISYSGLGAFTINAVHFPTQDTGYAVTDIGGVISTKNGGTNWNLQNVTLSGLWSVSFTSANIGFVAGGNGFNTGVVYRTTNGGSGWVSSTTSNTDTYTSIHFPVANTGYVCGQNGEIKKYNGTTGLSQFEKEDFFSLSPNPSTGEFTITTTEQNFTVTVYDMLGNKIYESANQKEINLSDKGKGIYLLKIISENKTYSQKLIIQ
jgi:photosystem II stability/assembly factor-like uncharacterized protein